MAFFHFEIDASATYSLTAPTLEVLVDGVVVSSAQITEHTGSGLDYLRFELEYSGTYPGTLQFRFNDGGEGGRNIAIDSVRINGWQVDTTYISMMTLLNGQTSSVSAASLDHLFGRMSPVLADLPAETVTGTTGDDHLIGSSQPEIINAGDGADRVRGRDNSDAIFGGLGSDTILGGAGNDIIVGEDGNDTLYGDDGNDLLHGNGGDDILNGGGGHDLLNGGVGVDILNGGNGDDIIYGEDGVDTISGGAGNDIVFGDAGNDIISGGAGADTVYGGLDNDEVYGEAGDDSLYGEGGDDIIYGGGGNDTLNGNNGNDMIRGGLGNDTIDGGDGLDYINGDAGNDMISGGLGNDILFGNAGTDTINGDDGNDTLNGGTGADTLNGGGGDDRLIAHSLDQAAIAAILAGNPGVVYFNETGNFYKYVNASVDYSTAESAAQASLLSGVAGHMISIGSAAENAYLQTLFSSGSVWLGASDGGGEGVWRWFGGSDDGAHFSDGGTAANGFYTNWAASNPDGGTTENFAVMSTAGTWTDVLPGALNGYIIEWEGISFSDDNAADSLNGDAGNDILFGGGGNDTLNGGNDVDRLFGSAGNDTLNGGNGNDYLVDYDGANTLNGDAGDDVLDTRYLPALTVPTISAQIQTILMNNSGVEYDSGTGNFYKYISGAVTWATANTNAPGNLINGVAAHLVTILSDDENDLVDQISGSANIWIGGTDSTVEGAWRWVTGAGAESGAQFWQGNASGSAQNGYYTNFNATQPNAGNTDEDYLGMTDGGLWTDERAATTRGYVIEWEGASLLVTPPAESAQSGMTVNGGSGNDTIYGGNATDTLNGDDDNDTIYSGLGDDLAHGGNHNDTIYGEGGVDELYGDAGNDILSGGLDGDTLYGGDGNDIVAGDDNSDVIYGGLGGDTLYASNRIYTHVSTVFTASAESFTYADGGFGGSDPGSDNASGTRITTDGAATASGALEVFLDGATATTETNISGSWALTFTASETTINTSLVFYYRVIHASGNDSGENAFVYASYDGVNYGVGGNSYVVQVNGGAGSVDTGWVQVSLDLGTVTAGSHTIRLGGFKNSKTAADEDTTFRFDDVRVMVESDSDSAGSNVLYGEDGDDVLYGSDGADTLYGGVGNDAVYSGSRIPVTVADILAANPGVVYNATTGSFYKFVSGSVVWTSANTAAQAAAINGVAGHLAVITDGTENSYVDTIAGATAVWLAGNDATTEGTWRWVAPGTPDNGMSFWLGGSGGSAQNGYYTNWRASNPAASSGTDDYLRQRDGGQWDDRTSTQTAAYVIEWEGANILTSVPTINYLYGGDGLDTLYGNEGQDIFVFEAAYAYNNVDVVNGFKYADDDQLDLSDLISGFDPLTENISDFVMISDGTATDSYMAAIKNYDALLYYRLGETSGTTAADSMGIRNGTYVNAPILNAADFNGGLTNNAVDFNGTDEYVRVTDSADFDLTEATFMGWFRSDTNSATQQTVMSKDGSTGGQFQIGVTTNDGDIVGLFQDGGGAAINFDINQSVALNTWYHLAISFSATSGVEIYLNGNSIYTNAGFTTALGSNYDFLIGAENRGGNTTVARYFNGRIDEVSVFSYKMSDQTVANTYNKGLAAVDGAFADGVYTDNTGTGTFGASQRVADFTGTTSVLNALDMLAGDNIIA